jgi:histidine ammonia-lyase
MAIATETGIVELTGQPLSLQEITDIAYGKRTVRIAPHAFEEMKRSRTVVEALILRQETA